MYGQMTAGSWIYIGSQGILQGTYETFAAAARKRFGGSLRGRLVVTAGLGGMGGAQPLAVTMCGGTALCVEVDLQRIERRLATGYLDERAADLDDALARLSKAAAEGARAVDRAAWQRGRGAARAGAPQRRRRRRHRPDLRPRPAQRLHPAGPDRRAGRRAAPEATRTTTWRASARPLLGARRGDPRAAADRRGGVRLRQRVARAGGGARRRRRVSNIPASSPRTSGRCSARARGRFDGSRCRAIPRTSTAPTRRSSTCSATRITCAELDPDGAREGPLPGAAGADLLARVRRTPPGGAALQRDGCAAASSRPRS